MVFMDSRLRGNDGDGVRRAAPRGFDAAQDRLRGLRVFARTLFPPLISHEDVKVFSLWLCALV
jgi:hypothetical protein